MNTIFKTTADAAKALEVKANTLSKQLKRGNNVVEMFDQKDREIKVVRNADKTIKVTFVEAPKPKQVKAFPSHHVHTQKSDTRMSAMTGLETIRDEREPGIHVTTPEGDSASFHNNTLAAKFAACTSSRISEIRRAAKVRQLDDSGSFTVQLKNGHVISAVRVNEIFKLRAEARMLAKAKTAKATK